MTAPFVRTGFTTLLVLSLTALFGCSKAPETANIQGRVLGYGILEAANASTNVAPGLAQATNAASLPPTISVTTNRIPAKLGLSFGMLYEVSGFKTNTDVVELVTLTRFPTMAFPDKTTANTFTRLTKSPVRNGRTWGISAFTFEQPVELVPGEWQLVVGYGNKTVAQQSFSVYADPAGGGTPSTGAPLRAPATTADPKAGSGK